MCIIKFISKVFLFGISLFELFGEGYYNLMIYGLGIYGLRIKIFSVYLILVWYLVIIEL